jgi:hypothetical protein
MNLSLVRHLWGVDLSQGLSRHVPRWRQVGYQALEASYRICGDREEFFRVLNGEGWAWIAQVLTDSFDDAGHWKGNRRRSVEIHLKSLREQIEEAGEHGPLFFNAQTGYDGWSWSEAEEFYGRCLEMQRELGVTLAHETHRGRYFATPWATVPLLERFPDLELTCDFSHWVCVCERLLPDWGDAISIAARHCRHLHARVGFEQGPQVSDPRVEAWRVHVETHERWWREIWASQLARGFSQSTLTPEFGPPTYQLTDPATGRPLADLEDVCDWMARRQKGSFTQNI